MGAGKWEEKESSRPGKEHELDLSDLNGKPLKGSMQGRGQICIKKKINPDYWGECIGGKKRLGPS